MRNTIKTRFTASYLPGLLIGLLLVFCSSQASALGLSPSRVTLNFVPDYVLEQDLCFSPKGYTTLQAGVTGDLKDHITLTGTDEDGIFDGTKCLHYTLKLPSKLDRPGQHSTFITGTEMPPDGGGSTISVVVSVTHQIYVMVPYPGKYLQIDAFTADNVAAGDNVPFHLYITSKGNETVGQAQGFISIYDINGKLVGSAKTKIEKEITHEDRRELFAKWNSTPYKQGNYIAVIKVIYDGLEVSANTSFKLGGMDISLIDYSKDFIKAGIKPFYITVDSIWSEPLRNVRGIISVLNLSNSTEPLQTFETLTREVPAWGTEKLTGYIDTESLNYAIYDLKIVVFYENLSKEYSRTLNISKEPVKPVVKEPFKWSIIFNSRNMLIIMLILLVVIVLIIIFSFRKKKPDQAQPPIKPIAPSEGEKKLS